MQELFAVKMSLGSIAAAQKRLSQTLDEPVAALHELVEREMVSLVDETSWKEKRNKPWLWVKATAKATVFRILPGRSQKDARAMIGKNEKGFVTSDRYPGYNHLAGANRDDLLDALKTRFSSHCRTDGRFKDCWRRLAEAVKRAFSVVAAGSRRNIAEA